MLAGYILDFRYINNCQFYICNTTPQNDPLIKQENTVKLVFKRSPLGHRKYNRIKTFERLFKIIHCGLSDPVHNNSHIAVSGRKFIVQICSRFVMLQFSCVDLQLISKLFNSLIA